jgi:hypothetical protein
VSPVHERTFEEICAASGLATPFAAGVIQRALHRGGLSRASVTPENLATALESIAAALSVFLPQDVAAERLAEITAIATPGRRASAGRGAP